MNKDKMKKTTIGEYTYVYNDDDTHTLCVYKDSSYPFVQFNPMSFRVNGKCMSPWGKDISDEQFNEIAVAFSDFLTKLETMVTENGGIK